MAKIGLKHIVAAEFDEAAVSPSAAYSNALIVGKAITASIEVEVNEATLYADDTLAESVKEFKNGSISLNTDDLEYTVQALLLGHATSADGLMTANKNDVAPYVGIGFYGEIIRSGVRKYRAVMFPKCQFSEPSDETNTKGDSIEFGTPTIEGTVFSDNSGVWKKEQIFDNETEAKTWVNSQLNLTV